MAGTEHRGVVRQFHPVAGVQRKPTIGPARSEPDGDGAGSVGSPQDRERDGPVRPRPLEGGSAGRRITTCGSTAMYLDSVQLVLNAEVTRCAGPHRAAAVRRKVGGSRVIVWRSAVLGQQY